MQKIESIRSHEIKSIEQMEKQGKMNWMNVPKFILWENIRDANLIRPSEPGYDPSTLDIPEK